MKALVYHGPGAKALDEAAKPARAAEAGAQSTAA